MMASSLGMFTGLLVSFGFFYFGIAWVLVQSYDDSRQSITDAIAKHEGRHKTDC